MKRHFINPDPIDDDAPRGRVLSRREALRLFGGIGGAALLAGTGVVRLLAQDATAEATATVAPSCVVKPEMTEGPYFVDEMLNRSDIRIEPSDGSIREGAVLNLIFNVTDVTNANACVPLPGAQVDVWQCDALGVYSDVNDASGLKFLRGYQITDDRGRAEFITIVPGWYTGRTTHIHFKIRTDPDSDSGYEFTSQLFFDTALVEALYHQPPYAEKGQPDTTNATDGIYAQGGDQLLLSPVQNEDGSYAAEFNIGLDLNDEEVGASDSMRSMGGRGGNPPNGQPPSR